MKMPDTYSGIVAATSRNMHLNYSGHLPTYETYLSMCRQMRERIAAISPDASDLCSRGVEYHSFGVSGWTGGETIAPMLWSIGNISNFFGCLTKSSTALVMTSFNEVIGASAHFDTVYTANCTSHKIFNCVSEAGEISNVVNLPWSSLVSAPPAVDYAHVGIFHFADSRILNAVVDSIAPGKVLVVANSSNGGELYDLTKSFTFAQEVHDEIMIRGSFTSFHLQGYVSYTIFIRND